MILTGVIIGVAFFAALFALLSASYNANQNRSSEKEEAEHAHTAVPGGDECLLCHAPLSTIATPDEAVSEIERKIAIDRKEVIGAMPGGAALEAAGSSR